MPGLGLERGREAGQAQVELVQRRLAGTLGGGGIEVVAAHGDRAARPHSGGGGQRLGVAQLQAREHVVGEAVPVHRGEAQQIASIEAVGGIDQAHAIPIPRSGHAHGRPLARDLVDHREVGAAQRIGREPAACTASAEARAGLGAVLQLAQQGRVGQDGLGR